MAEISWKRTDRKKKISILSIFVLLIAAGIFLVIKFGFNILDSGGSETENSANLALQQGVRARCDSMETEELSADKAIDGDDSSLSSRWSSENNWDNASHLFTCTFIEFLTESLNVRTGLS